MTDEEMYKTLDEFRNNYDNYALQVSKKFEDRKKSIQTKKNSSPYVAIREGNIANDGFLQAQMIKVENNMSPETADFDALIRIFAPRAGVVFKSGTYTYQYLDVKVIGAGTLNTNWVVCDGNNLQYVPVEKHIFTEEDVGIQRILFRTTEYGALSSEVNTITNILSPVDFISSVNNSTTYSKLGQFTQTKEELREEVLRADRSPHTDNEEKLMQELKNNGCEEAKVFYNYYDDVYIGVKPHNVGIVVNGGEKTTIAKTIAEVMKNCTCQTGYIYQSSTEKQQNYLYQTDYGIMSIKWNIKNDISTKLYFTLYKTSTETPDLSKLKTYIVNNIISQKLTGIYKTININAIKNIIDSGLKEQEYTDISVEDVLLSIDNGTTKQRILTPTKLDDYYLFTTDNIEITEQYE